MVGQTVLVRLIGVRVPVSQQNEKTLLSSGVFSFLEDNWGRESRTEASM